MKISKEKYRQILNEYFNDSSVNKNEIELSISLEMCRSYSKMITDSFDKCLRNSVNKDELEIQFEIISRHIESLKKEIENSKKNIKNIG